MQLPIRVQPASFYLSLQFKNMGYSAQNFSSIFWIICFTHIQTCLHTTTNDNSGHTILGVWSWSFNKRTALWLPSLLICGTYSMQLFPAWWRKCVRIPQIFWGKMKIHVHISGWGGEIIRVQIKIGEVIWGFTSIFGVWWARLVKVVSYN